MFDGENVYFDASLFIYINSTIIPPTMIIMIMINGLLDLDAGRLARSQNPEGPATCHLDPGFLGFPGS